MNLTTEIYTKGFDHHKDWMTLQVEKCCETKEPRYRIMQMEVQMYQTKERLVEWLRACADAVEEMP